MNTEGGVVIDILTQRERYFIRLDLKMKMNISSLV
jgi:hypothetical protein